MPRTFRPPSRPAGPMLSPIAVQGPDEQSLRPDQLRALQEAQTTESARRAETEMRPKTGMQAMTQPGAGGAGLVMVIAAGGLLVLFLLLTLLGFLGIRI